FRLPGVVAVEVLAGLDRLRDEMLMVLPPHPLGQIREADVEVRLEHKMDRLSGHNLAVSAVEKAKRRRQETVGPMPEVKADARMVVSGSRGASIEGFISWVFGNPALQESSCLSLTRVDPA